MADLKKIATGFYSCSFLKGQFGGPPPVPGMGRGYPGYSAIPQGYPGAPNMVTPGYGYGKSRYTANLSFFS